jgi:hypothetical protein
MMASNGAYFSLLQSSTTSVSTVLNTTTRDGQLLTASTAPSTCTKLAKIPEPSKFRENTKDNAN